MVGHERAQNDGAYETPKAPIGARKIGGNGYHSLVIFCGKTLCLGLAIFRRAQREAAIRIRVQLCHLWLKNLRPEESLRGEGEAKLKGLKTEATSSPSMVGHERAQNDGAYAPKAPIGARKIGGNGYHSL